MSRENKGFMVIPTINIVPILSAVMKIKNVDSKKMK